MPLAEKQIKVIFVEDYKELFNEQWRFIVFDGGRVSGKSQNTGKALIIRGRQKKLRILCTREIQNTIKDSVHKLLKDIIDEHGFIDYEVTNDAIRNKVTGTEFIFRGLRYNTNEIKSLEGVDICWVEEAQAVSEASWQILVPTIRKPGSQIIATFNRFNELDPVYVRFVMNKPPNTYYRRVNYDALERAGLLPDVSRQEIEYDKANNPSLYAHKWLGEPLSQTDLAILDRDRVLAAMGREVEADGKKIVGVDVARMGNDRTVLWMRKGFKTLRYIVLQHKRTTEVCDALEQFIAFDKTCELRVDDTGVGGGVTDEMIKREYEVVAINFGGEPGDKTKYPNWISEAWFNMVEIIDEIQLPFDSDLLMELTSRAWRQDNKGKRAVESKADYKKRGYRSPDLADACIICYAELTPAPAGIVNMSFV